MLWLDVNGYTFLNVYRKPGRDEVIDYVTNLTPPNNSLIGGEWNVWHPEFEPGDDDDDDDCFYERGCIY